MILIWIHSSLKWGRGIREIPGRVKTEISLRSTNVPEMLASSYKLSAVQGVTGYTKIDTTFWLSNLSQ